MIPTDLPFDFKRLKFPVRLAFAMTLNKSQGQSLEVCRINLKFLFRAWMIICCVFARRKTFTKHVSVNIKFEHYK
ncbi:hypothetical protein HELRODRAFT_71363 [Helobdella robusta]|uniref:ATP-dependent DNA helicase n=1 Tax=Helobdella robusta TaxID=6412 RepID=T1G0K4_HELRO|nr:hypothetical protein HELRODRAFT_71363 [Helobdella robusta]ESO11894.1 hypothetical protein HELRODRAFT_71363 [Helobdella robusta]